MVAFVASARKTCKVHTWHIGLHAGRKQGPPCSCCWQQGGAWSMTCQQQPGGPSMLHNMLACCPTNQGSCRLMCCCSKPHGQQYMLQPTCSLEQTWCGVLSVSGSRLRRWSCALHRPPAELAAAHPARVHCTYGQAHASQLLASKTLIVQASQHTVTAQYQPVWGGRKDYDGLCHLH